MHGIIQSETEKKNTKKQKTKKQKTLTYKRCNIIRFSVTLYTIYLNLISWPSTPVKSPIINKEMAALFVSLFKMRFFFNAKQLSIMQKCLKMCPKLSKSCFNFQFHSKNVELSNETRFIRNLPTLDNFFFFLSIWSILLWHLQVTTTLAHWWLFVCTLQKKLSVSY